MEGGREGGREEGRGGGEGKWRSKKGGGMRCLNILQSMTTLLSASVYFQKTALSGEVCFLRRI